MKTLLKTVLPILVLAVAAFGAKVLVDSAPEAISVTPEPVIPTVRAIELESTTYVVEVETQGTVVPRTESNLVAQVGGRVTAVSPALVAGGFFEAGELLVELDSRDYQLALAQAELNVAQAERRLAEEEADAAVARDEWKQLGQGEPTPLAVRVPQVNEAKAALAAAEAGRARAELDVERTQLKATFAGRVRSKGVDLGQYVMPGSVLARVYAVDYAEVRLPLPDHELAFLDLPVSFRDREATTKGPEVRLTAHFAGGDREWSARIVRTEGEIDPQTRMVMAVARVEDPYGRESAAGGHRIPLAVGMFVQAAISGVQLDDVYVVPRSALRDGSRVFVLEPSGEGDVLSMVDVQVVRSGREDVIVRGSALRGGQRVIVTPLEVVTEGMRVWDLASDVQTDGITSSNTPASE